MKLKINESKTLEFEMDTSGCSWKELKGHLRMTLEDVEYGFPAEIDEGIVRVNIPVFKDVLNEGIKSSLYKHKEVTVRARLDLIANNEAYVSPWSGDIDIEIPVSVKITEERDKEKTDIKVVDPSIKEYLDEEKKSKRKKKLLENLDNVDLDESRTTKKEEKVEEKQEVKDKEVRKVKKSKFAKTLA